MNEIETKAVFETIFGIGSTSGLTISNEDKEKAKLFLDELVKGSCKMSAIEGVFRQAFSFNPTIIGVIKSVAGSYAKGCICSDGKFYVVIRDTLRLNWRSAFEIRKQTGEW